MHTHNTFIHITHNTHTNAHTHTHAHTQTHTPPPGPLPHLQGQRDDARRRAAAAETDMKAMKALAGAPPLARLEMLPLALRRLTSRHANPPPPPPRADAAKRDLARVNHPTAYLIAQLRDEVCVVCVRVCVVCVVCVKVIANISKAL